MGLSKPLLLLLLLPRVLLLLELLLLLVLLQGRPSNKKIQKVPSYLLPLKIRKWGMESAFVPFLKYENRSSELSPVV